MCPGGDSWTRCHMWVEFVVGSLPCSDRFFSGYSGSVNSVKIIKLENLKLGNLYMYGDNTYNGFQEFHF